MSLSKEDSTTVSPKYSTRVDGRGRKRRQVSALDHQQLNKPVEMNIKISVNAVWALHLSSDKVRNQIEGNIAEKAGTVSIS
jgi:hypothetical protein